MAECRQGSCSQHRERALGLTVAKEEEEEEEEEAAAPAAAIEGEAPSVATAACSSERRTITSGSKSAAHEASYRSSSCAAAWRNARADTHVWWRPIAYCSSRREGTPAAAGAATSEFAGLTAANGGAGGGEGANGGGAREAASASASNPDAQGTRQVAVWRRARESRRPSHRGGGSNPCEQRSTALSDGRRGLADGVQAGRRRHATTMGRISSASRRFEGSSSICTPSLQRSKGPNRRLQQQKPCAQAYTASFAASRVGSFERGARIERHGRSLHGDAIIKDGMVQSRNLGSG